MKLNSTTLTQLTGALNPPEYHRQDLKHGIVHIGVGGFHRAHQAVYTERLLRKPGSDAWGICGVGLRDADRAMQSAMAKQDCLYSVVELDPEGNHSVSVIGAMTDFLFAPEDPQSVLAKLVDPDVRIVSLTITEGGYNVDDHTGAFNASHPDILHDLENPLTPKSVFAFLTEALDQRRSKGIPPFTVMSCDNLPHNGDVTRKVMLAYAGLRDTQLQEWIAEHVTFPNSMVDRITPVTSDSQKQWLSDAHDLQDEWPVFCEPFIQWVLEDKFCSGRPDWDTVGVEFTDDVMPFELAKIRLLNGSHLSMGLLGVLAGYRYAHELMDDSVFLDFVRDFMDQDVSPLLSHIQVVDIDAYKQTLIERFSNPQIADQLQRLALDGSGKMPKFIIPTIHSLIAEGRPLNRVALIIAGWVYYLSGQDEHGNLYDIQDPMVERLQESIRDSDRLKENFLGMTDIFGDEILGSSQFVELFERSLNALESQGVKPTLKRLHETGSVG